MIKRFSVFVLCCLMAGGAWAYDFSLTVASGQTLYFSILGANVEIVYPNNTSYPVNGWDDFTRPVGDLRIPSTVVHDGVAYNVVSIGQLAFNGCTGLTSVVMSDGLTSLGNSAFNGCTALATVVIPSTIDTIGLRSFGECHQLADVWIAKNSLPRASAYVFYNMSLANSVLHVPQEALQTYMAASPWGSFGTILGDGPMATLSVESNDALRGSVTGGGVYEVGSTVEISAVPVAGQSFICWNDGDMQNPRTLTLTGNRSLIAMFFPLQYDTVDFTEVHRLQVFSSQEGLGVGVGSTEVPVGTVVEICALPLQGGHFTGWSDGSNANPRRVTVTGDMAFTAFFEQLSVASPETASWKVRTEGREVVVDGANGLEIEIYDAAGRRILASVGVGECHRLLLPTAGVFVVRVGEMGAVKVTVE